MEKTIHEILKDFWGKERWLKVEKESQEEPKPVDHDFLNYLIEKYKIEYPIEEDIKIERVKL